LLCLAVRVPVPADDGESMRVVGLLRSLSAHHDVDFVSVLRPETDECAETGLDVLLSGRLQLFAPRPPASPSRVAAAKRWAIAVARGEPPWSRAHWHPEVAHYVAGVGDRYDAVVFLDNAVTIHLPAIASTVPLIVDVHNVEGWSVKSGLRSGSKALSHRLRAVLSIWLTRRCERRSVSAVHGVIVTSEEESRRLFGLYGISADAVIPSAVDLPPRPLRATGMGTVGWIGGHGYEPNREGLVRFVHEAWEPLGRAGYRLLIAGADPPADILKLRTVDGVEILGYVDDVESFLSQLDVAVVPLWSGAGVKLKTVTFLGSGIPLVSTAVGVEGTGVADGIHALVRESPAGIAAAVQALLADPGLADRVSANGRALVAQHLTWANVGADFVSAVERLVDAASATRAVASRPGGPG
jgi:glycosyltransferase involved in cell wall biosynthesis